MNDLHECRTYMSPDNLRSLGDTTVQYIRETLTKYLRTHTEILKKSVPSGLEAERERAIQELQENSQTPDSNELFEQLLAVLKLLNKNLRPVGDAALGGPRPLHKLSLQQCYEHFQGEDMRIYVYFRIIYWTLDNYFACHRTTCLGLESEESKVVKSVFEKFVFPIPVFGEVLRHLHEAVSAVNEAHKKLEWSARVRAINSIIYLKLKVPENLTLEMKWIALNSTLLRQKLLVSDDHFVRKSFLERSFGPPSMFYKAKDTLRKIKIILMKVNQFPYEPKFKGAYYQAFLDAALIISIFYQYSTEICESTNCVSEFVHRLFEKMHKEATLNK